jgi:hypothetical protein
MRLQRLLPLLLLLTGCATLEESLFGGQSSFVRTDRQVGEAIEIGRDDTFGYAVAYLPVNVRREGITVTIQTEWIDRSANSTRKVFVLDCPGKRYRITQVGYGNEPNRPSSSPDFWMKVTPYQSTSEVAVFRTFCN